MAPVGIDLCQPAQDSSKQQYLIVCRFWLYHCRIRKGLQPNGGDTAGGSIHAKRGQKPVP